MRQRLLIQSFLTLLLCLSLNVATTAQDKHPPENGPPKQEWGWLTKHLSDISGSSAPRQGHSLTPGEELAQAHTQMKELRRELDAARAELEAHKEQNRALVANLEAEAEKRKKAGLDERERADILAQEFEVSQNERLALQRELDMAQEQKLGIQQEQQRATKLAAKLALDLAAARQQISAYTQKAIPASHEVAGESRLVAQTSQPNRVERVPEASKAKVLRRPK
jgi:predicted  nucleic acid-binding Zn-ribbon protein